MKTLSPRGPGACVRRVVTATVIAADGARSRSIGKNRFAVWASPMTSGTIVPIINGFNAMEDYFAFLWPVEAQLANPVRGLLASQFQLVSESSSDDRCQFVLAARLLCLRKFLKLCARLLQLIFQTINLVTRGGLLLLQGKSRILNINDAIVDRLLHFREFQFITRRDSSLRQVNGVLETGDRSGHGHDWHFVPRSICAGSRARLANGTAPQTERLLKRVLA